MRTMLLQVEGVRSPGQMPQSPSEQGTAKSEVFLLHQGVTAHWKVLLHMEVQHMSIHCKYMTASTCHMQHCFLSCM